MTSPKRNSNLHKRGNTWTYYLYVTEGDGSRRQISKGGFATRRDAEAARAEALAAINTGTFVRPDRLSLRDFLVDEWLPSQRPPTLEESTYRSYSWAATFGKIVTRIEMKSEGNGSGPWTGSPNSSTSPNCYATRR